MYTRIAAVIIALGTLGATPALTGTLQLTHSHANQIKSSIIEKNQNWPIKGLISMTPCAVRLCIDV